MARLLTSLVALSLHCVATLGTRPPFVFVSTRTHRYRTIHLLSVLCVLLAEPDGQWNRREWRVVAQRRIPVPGQRP